jgi:hypothetical protein
MAIVQASMVDGTFMEKYGRDGASAIEDGDILLSNAWRHYRGSASRPDASPQTIRQYEYQWERLLEWLRGRHPGVRRVSQVTRQLAQEFAAHLAGQVSANTFNKYIQLFRLVFRVLCDDLGTEAIRPAKPTGPVCPRKAAQYLRNKAEVAKRFLKLFRQCGIRTSAPKEPNGARATCEVGFHSFRHTWVTRAAEDGVDAITIRQVVGWGSPAMERIYTHVSPEHVRAQMGKRTSKAFNTTVAEPTDTPAEIPAVEVATMGTDRIRELAKALAEELAKRESEKG